VDNKCSKGTDGCRWGPMIDHTCETGDAFRERMRLRDLATEERLAWDRFAAGYASNNLNARLAADEADALLEERRKRFGGPK
jgi:hypothetical protein